VLILEGGAAVAIDNRRPVAAALRLFGSVEVYALRGRSMRGRATDNRRFPTAAEAVRFAIAESPGPLLAGTVTEVREERSITTLFASPVAAHLSTRPS